MENNVLKGPFTKKSSAAATVQGVLSDVDVHNLESMLVCGYNPDGTLFVRGANINPAQRCRQSKHLTR